VAAVIGSRESLKRFGDLIALEVDETEIERTSRAAAFVRSHICRLSTSMITTFLEHQREVISRGHSSLGIPPPVGSECSRGITTILEYVADESRGISASTVLGALVCCKSGVDLPGMGQSNAVVEGSHRVSPVVSPSIGFQRRVRLSALSKHHTEPPRGSWMAQTVSARVPTLGLR
jgi:hypothetical protein